MTPVPARCRRPLVSLLLGVLAMGGSFATLGAFVISDVAAADERTAPAEVQEVQKERDAVENAPTVQTGSEHLDLEIRLKPAMEKRARKRSKIDLGRYEGY